MAETLTTRSKDGIEWFCYRQGSGPDLILVPSGEGDCESFFKVAALLSDSFTVTTFDMPGMSRTIAPAEAVKDVTGPKLATQIVGLLDELHIDAATFYGCSSGGLAVLSLVAYHETRVRSAIVHEVPLHIIPEIKSLLALSDSEIVKICRHIFSESMCESRSAWEAQSAAYHARLEKNFVTWARNYLPEFQILSFSKEVFHKRPITWTIGALSPAGDFFDNVTTACRADLPIDLLPCKHFPQVSIPEIFAEHLRTAAKLHSS